MANTILFSSRDHNAHLLATIVHGAGLRGCGGWPGRDKDNPLEAAGRALPSTYRLLLGLRGVRVTPACTPHTRRPFASWGFV